MVSRDRVLAHVRLIIVMHGAARLGDCLLLVLDIHVLYKQHLTKPESSFLPYFLHRDSTAVGNLLCPALNMVARLALRESYECLSTAVRRVVVAMEETTRAVGVGRHCMV